MMHMRLKRQTTAATARCTCSFMSVPVKGHMMCMRLTRAKRQQTPVGMLRPHIWSSERLSRRESERGREKEGERKRE